MTLRPYGNEQATLYFSMWQQKASQSVFWVLKSYSLVFTTFSYADHKASHTEWRWRNKPTFGKVEPCGNSPHKRQLDWHLLSIQWRPVIEWDKKYVSRQTNILRLQALGSVDQQAALKYSHYNFLFVLMLSSVSGRLYIVFLFCSFQGAYLLPVYILRSELFYSGSYPPKFFYGKDLQNHEKSRRLIGILPRPKCLSKLPQETSYGTENRIWQ